jgi:hypothetical protein
VTYQVPASPIPQHLAFGLGLGGAVTGVVALVLVVCATIYDWPAPPVTMTAIVAAFLGASSLILWCAERITAHQAACLEANRDASRVEVEKAAKGARKEIASWRREYEAREALRLTRAFGEGVPDVSHLRSVE